jgi:hypothetical protein
MDAPRVAVGICEIKLLDIRKIKILKYWFRTLCYLEKLHLAWNNVSLEKMLADRDYFKFHYHRSLVGIL